MTQLSKLDRETKGLKVFPLFTFLGWAFIGIAVLIGVVVISSTAADYWGGNVKAVRDAAAAGSGLLGQLTTIQAVPKAIQIIIITISGTYIWI